MKEMMKNDEGMVDGCSAINNNVNKFKKADSELQKNNKDHCINKKHEKKSGLTRNVQVSQYLVFYESSIQSSLKKTITVIYEF